MEASAPVVLVPCSHALRLTAILNGIGTEWDIQNVQKVLKLNWNFGLYWDWGGFWVLKRIPEWLLIGWFMNARVFFWLDSECSKWHNTTEIYCKMMPGQCTLKIRCTVLLSSMQRDDAWIVNYCASFRWFKNVCLKIGKRKRNIYTSLTLWVHRVLYANKKKSNLRQ